MTLSLSNPPIQHKSIIDWYGPSKGLQILAKAKAKRKAKAMTNLAAY